MLKIELQIQRANLIPRMHAKLMRNINRRTMERQLTERVPLHFEMVAYSRYGARQRSVKYNQYKMSGKGEHRHITPNVLTGHLKRSIRGKVTATQYGAKLAIRASLNRRVPPDEWAQMTAEQQARWKRKNLRRLANWQKREIAVLSKDEIREERKRNAREYRNGALSPEYKRKRSVRIK
jgi:hypothetical protein